jgi:GDP-4-dehydro-6-deoxy-D-mannose reductase
MRVLVTGASGFVAPYFVKAIEEAASNCEVFGCARGRTLSDAKKPDFLVDVTDEAAVDALISDVRPTHVMHLAGVSTVVEAEFNPKAAWQINVFGTLNVARSILRHSPECVLLFAGSGEVYGASANQLAPLTEEALLQPMSEYAVTKAAADLAIGALSNTGLRNIRLRAFNHVGAGQNENHALSSFAAQIARIEEGIQSAIISVGNLSVERDFLDVQDVADAYAKAILCSDEILSGTILNIASGKLLQLNDLLHRLIDMAKVDVQVERDSARFRTVDLPKIYGDASKARQMLNWTPRRSFDQTLLQLLDSWRAKIRTSN